MTGRTQQRGAALLMAMIIVTLVATLASAMIWQQWRAVQVESAERARAQSAWILAGALDWARLILREDARTGGPDHLGEPWAVPLAEARLSTFLAVDTAHVEDAPEAFLSGSITDMQARYNLRRLVDNGQVVDGEVLVLQRLFDSIGVAPDLAERIAAGLRNASATPGTKDAPPDAPLMPETIAQLAWFGIDAGSLQSMAPYVVLLPERTPVNLNTAPREVIAAVISGLDLGGAERLVQVRQRTPFKKIDDALQHLPPTIVQRMDAKAVNISSSFFEIRGRLRLDDRVLEESSLVQRRGREVVPLSRRRENTRELPG